MCTGAVKSMSLYVFKMSSTSHGYAVMPQNKTSCSELDRHHSKICISSPPTHLKERNKEYSLLFLLFLKMRHCFFFQNSSCYFGIEIYNINEELWTA